ADGNFSGGMEHDKVLGEHTPQYLIPALCSTPNAQHEKILEHLECILSHTLFRNSKRYAAVLRYIVEGTLKGNKSQLKERTIGIEVFSRTPDYDTANDHVVRSAMSEVRRRLAQYYREAASESEVRIDLQPGSYVPHFCRVVNDGPGASVAPVGVPLSEVVPIRPPQLLTRIWRRGVLLGILAVLAAVTLLSRAYWSDPLQTVWSPVFSAPGPVLLCVGTLGQGRQSAGGIAAPKSPVTLSDFHSSTDQLIHINDAITVAALARLLGQHK